MKRYFFKECYHISDTESNRLFNTCLSNIENKFINIFNVSEFNSLHDFSEKVIRNNPKVIYFFKWMKEDSNFYNFGSIDLKNHNDKLLDEFNMTNAILNNIHHTDINVVCSDLADLIYFLDKALKEVEE